jgi:RNA-directed DNA polymerase
LIECGLELHPLKTKIVYCQDTDRRAKYENVRFDFLGYAFQPRRARSRFGNFFVSFLPAVSAKAAKSVRETIREWRMGSTRNNRSLDDLAHLVNPVVRGWTNYYGRYYPSKWKQVLRALDRALVTWVCRKFLRFRRRERAATHWLGRIARRQPTCSLIGSLVYALRLGQEEPDEARVSRPVL